MSIKIIKELAHQTRDIMREKLRDPRNIRSKNHQSLSDKFTGLCGFAQVIGLHALEDAGLKAYPFSTQSLQTPSHDHVSLIVHAKQDIYIFDPTFVQFMNNPKPNPFIIDIGFSRKTRTPPPEDHLKKSALGQQMLRNLSQDGFVKMTPDVAQAYIASFYAGKEQFTTANNAFDFLKKPPSHPSHYLSGRGNSDNARQELEKQGLLLNVKPPNIK